MKLEYKIKKTNVKKLVNYILLKKVQTKKQKDGERNIQ